MEVLSDGVTLKEASSHCFKLIEEYKNGIKNLERRDVVAKSGTIIAGIGGIYEGVTGGSTRAITNFAAAGALLYADQQFLIRRPTRVDIYNFGIRQINCIVQNSPASESLDWLLHLETSKGHSPENISELAVDFVRRINHLLNDITHYQCDLPSTIEVLKAKKLEVLTLQKFFQNAGSRMLNYCEAVATQVSSAINKDSPSIDDIQVYLSGVSLPRKGADIADPASLEGTRGLLPVGPCGNEMRASYLKDSRQLVVEIETVLDFVGSEPATQMDTCVAAIVPQVLRLAGHSPYSVKKSDPGAELKIQVLGGTDPIAIQRQQAGNDAPTAAYDQTQRQITVTAGKDVQIGAFVYSVFDRAGSSLEFVVVVEE